MPVTTVMSLPDPIEQGMNPEDDIPPPKLDLTSMKFPATEMDLVLGMNPDEFYGRGEPKQFDTDVHMAKWIQSEM